MPDMMFQALDLTGLNETAEQVRAIVQAAKSEIEAELDSLDYAQPDGIYPEMTVGAVIGADETAQWAQRESTGSGSAIVRSVQGAAVVFRQMYDYIRRPSAVYNGVDVVNNSDGSITLSGTATADAVIRWNDNQNYSLLADHKYLGKFCPSGGSANTYVAYDAWSNRFTDYGTGVIFSASSGGTAQPVIKVLNGTTVNMTFYPQLFDLTAMFGSGNEPTTVTEFEAMYPADYYPYSSSTLKPVQIAGIASTDAQGNALDIVEWETQTLRAAGSVRDELTAGELVTRVGERTYQSGDESDATVRTDGTTTYYPLATPIMTTINPALPMTYKVQADGSESIIIPDGEISAAPIITIAEPVNMSTELALIWAAIEALQGSRNSALGSVRSDSDVSSTEVKEAPTMDEKQTTERESEI